MIDTIRHLALFALWVAARALPIRNRPTTDGLAGCTNDRFLLADSPVALLAEGSRFDLLEGCWVASRIVLRQGAFHCARGPMRLRGSKTESDLRAEILDATSTLLQGSSGQYLLDSLVARMPGFRTAHVLCVLPDQEEDVMLILVDGLMVLRIVRDRTSGGASVEWAIPKEDYARTLKSRPSRLRLAVAVDLASATAPRRP